MRMRTRRTPIVVARRAGRQMAGKLACYSITPERVVTPKMQCDELRLEPGDTLCKLIRWEEVRKNPIAALMAPIGRRSVPEPAQSALLKN